MRPPHGFHEGRHLFHTHAQFVKGFFRDCHGMSFFAQPVQEIDLIWKALVDALVK